MEVPTVTPSGAVAVQSTVAALLPRLVSRSVASPLAPGATMRPSLVGPVAASTRSPPVVSDGGAASGPVAHEVLGCVESAKSIDVAERNWSKVSQAAFHSLPLTSSACT